MSQGFGMLNKTTAERIAVTSHERRGISLIDNSTVCSTVVRVNSKENGNAQRASLHYDGVTMGAMASQITSLTIVFSTVYLGADQRKDQSSASLAFVQGIHRGPVNSPHKWPVTQKMFPFDDVIMGLCKCNPPAQVNFPLYGIEPVMMKAFPCHDVFMTRVLIQYKDVILPV